MRHVSRTHRVALDWLFDRINLDTKIQIKYIDTKNQLADILTKGNFMRDGWNHLLCVFNISHFSSTVLLCCDGKTISTRFRRRMSHSKIETYDESCCRTPSFVSSSTSVSPVKKYYGSQDPWRSIEGEDRSGRPDKGTGFYLKPPINTTMSISWKLLFNKLFKIG